MKNYNLFLITLLVSMIGNSAADFAILWEAVAAKGNTDTTISLMTFYVAQAVGAIILAPLLAIWIDRTSKYRAAMTLDLAYIGLMVTVALAYYKFGLNSFVALFFGFLSSGIGMAHRSGIAGIVVRMASSNSSANSAVSRYTTCLNYVSLAGTAISGFVYSYLGFVGTLIFAGLTFLPIALVYRHIFIPDSQNIIATDHKNNFDYWGDFKSAWQFYFQDKVLSRTMFAVAVLNVGSALFPAIVVYALNIGFPGRTDIPSLTIAAAIFVGTMIIGPFGRVADSFKLRDTFIWSVLPALSCLVAGVVLETPLFYVVGFFMGCFGSALRNTMTGILRVNRVPANMIARVTTINISLLSAGQAIGALLIAPNLKENLTSSVWVVIGSAMLAITTIYWLVGAEKISDLKRRTEQM
jgi:hypothetical protein